MKLWGSRFETELDPAAYALNASISFDQRLALQDVRGSIAWAEGLQNAGALTAEESAAIRQGLNNVAEEFKTGAFVFKQSDEDIHTAVERRLGEMIGPVAGKLHTGRSRNDQVATDFRLWLLDHIPELDAALAEFQSATIERAQTDMGTLIPGYTHLQRAQPILLSHWWLSHFWPIQRDRQRLTQLRQRTATLPLGSGALAGTPIEIDRHALCTELGFSRPSANSIDAVSERDFAAEFLFCAAMIGIHLSKLAESVILFSSAEFGFFELSDAFTTGSSLMPQKKNPDPFELARGKAGPLLGYLISLLTTLKGLPSAYDKDLQEDKVPVFNAYDTLMALLPVLANALRTSTINAQRTEEAIDASMMATDLADYLVAKGIPFREAHHLVGKAVRLAGTQGVELDNLVLEEYQSLDSAFDPDLYDVFNPQTSVTRYKAIGGTAPEAVLTQLQQAKESLAKV